MSAYTREQLRAIEEAIGDATDEAVVTRQEAIEEIVATAEACVQLSETHRGGPIATLKVQARANATLYKDMRALADRISGAAIVGTTERQRRRLVATLFEVASRGEEADALLASYSSRGRSWGVESRANFLSVMMSLWDSLGSPKSARAFLRAVADPLASRCGWAVLTDDMLRKFLEDNDYH